MHSPVVVDHPVCETENKSTPECIWYHTSNPRQTQNPVMAESAQNPATTVMAESARTGARVAENRWLINE